MKKWYRLEHPWDKRERAERDTHVKWIPQTQKTLSGAQQEEQRRNAEAAWATYRRRHESPELYAAFEEAYRNFWERYGQTLSSLALQIYLHSGDGKSIDAEPFIAYLERGAWASHSQYTKANILQYLKQAELTESERTRLHQIVLSAVDGRGQSDFRYYIGLAQAADTPSLRAALRARLSNHAGSIRRRAARMLDILGERDAERKT